MGALIALVILSLWLPIMNILSGTLGVILVFFLPGFCLTGLIFPQTRPTDEPTRIEVAGQGYQSGTDMFERIFLSLFFSLSLTALIFWVMRYFAILTSLKIIYTEVIMNLILVCALLIVKRWHKKH
ncbi:hypothetical protein A2482_00775 [Candidatus Falkowbacteria bacterium RIFOXYC2_FULL_48_21]|uniref:DUF1616 domain-containing protein n=1 Tax=Candidatus Falkowbacteria bacterium RIFOXYC2_FULL_48_21 TaxID=1798005 RepID=A0A1F5T761_9BACT|nr:MAG: hypothetical protein A2482_00775 [Candidatus Falkowbacteria bacterium RIFOXYC2_FULL_48_21]